jgi:hypothetical protein
MVIQIPPCQKAQALRGEKMSLRKPGQWGRHRRGVYGYVRIEFTDASGKDCCLWEFPGTDGEGRLKISMAGRPGPSLSVQQVEEMLPFLQHFVDEGCLPIPPEEREED